MQQEVIARNWRQLIRPRRLELEEGEGDGRYRRFWCEPLERGFGQTLGNALRRVLLSSLQGAAITTVRIAGVLHEFSTIPGVLEDVSDIVLNLKEVRLRLHSRGPKTLRVHSSGEGVLRAGDLVSDDATVEIVNPDRKIATLSPDGSPTLVNDRGTPITPTQRQLEAHAFTPTNPIQIVGAPTLTTMACPSRSHEPTHVSNARSSPIRSSRDSTARPSTCKRNGSTATSARPAWIRSASVTRNAAAPVRGSVPAASILRTRSPPLEELTISSRVKQHGARKVHPIRGRTGSR